MKPTRSPFAIGSVTLAFLLALPAVALGQSRVGTTAGTFLTLGAGARQNALGQASTAYVTGADALFWNPGAAPLDVSGRTRGGVMFSNHEMFAGIGVYALGLTIPVSAGVVGFSVTSVDYGRMDVTSEDQPEGTGESFAPSDLAVGLTYAQPLTDAFYIGGTAKYVGQRIRDMRAQTVAFDLGFVLVTNYLNGSRLAASISNFGGKMRYEGVNGRVFVDTDPDNTGNNPSIPANLQTDRWDLPLSFRLGVAVPAFKTANAELLLLSDVQQSNDFDLNADIGAQARYVFGAVAASGRIGYRDLGPAASSVDTHLSYGGGIEYDLRSLRFGLDFAFVPHDYLGLTRTVDFRLSF